VGFDGQGSNVAERDPGSGIRNTIDADDRLGAH
jgi:hypothetical protein